MIYYKNENGRVLRVPQKIQKQPIQITYGAIRKITEFDLSNFKFLRIFGTNIDRYRVKGNPIRTT